MYNNFEDVFYKLSVDQAGGVAAYKMMSNPSKVDPNESQYCIEFTKVNVQWANVYMQLSKGYRFDLRTQSKFKMMVYGEAGTKVLLKLENTDLGGNAWQTGVELIYTIQQSNKWEEATYNFSGVANNGSADPKVTDVVADSRTNNGYYNVVRVMVNPGDGGATYKVLLDNLAGPVVQDLK